MISTCSRMSLSRSLVPATPTPPRFCSRHWSFGGNAASGVGSDRSKSHVPVTWLRQIQRLLSAPSDAEGQLPRQWPSKADRSLCWRHCFSQVSSPSTSKILSTSSRPLHSYIDDQPMRQAQQQAQQQRNAPDPGDLHLGSEGVGWHALEVAPSAEDDQRVIVGDDLLCTQEATYILAHLHAKGGQALVWMTHSSDCCLHCGGEVAALSRIC